MTHIIIADDDIEMCKVLCEYLESEGFSAIAKYDGASALSAVMSGHYDLLILDVMMPRMSGFDVLRELRRSSSIPVLILTARDEDIDIVLGLELGADDYLCKPCNPHVLASRIRAILRRSESHTASDQGILATDSICVGDVEMQIGSRTVNCDGKLINLSSTEFSILEVLLQVAGKAVTKEDLSNRVLGREYGPSDRSVDMHVSNIRKKMGPLPDGGERIKTVRGKGYQYVNQ